MMLMIMGRFWLTEAANNPEFLDAAQQYPQDVFVTGEILRITPAAFAPLDNRV